MQRPSSCRPRPHPRLLLVGLVALVVVLTGGLAHAQPSGSTSPFLRVPLPSDGFVADDTRSVTLGIRFTPAVDGYVTGVEFRKDSTSNTAQRVQLWDATTGTQVATSARMTLGTGLVRQWFDAPVAVLAGHEYVASYLAPAGRYNVTRSAHDAVQTTGPLTVPVNAGVYAYGRKVAYPTNSYRAADYHVTPVFVANTATGSPMHTLAAPAGSTVDSDASSVTLGVRFTPAADGYVTGVEFLRGSTANTGRAVQLWDAQTGSRLATSSRIPVGTGVVRQWFDVPVAVTAGRQYVASYLAPAGRYNSVTGARTDAQTSGPLTAPAGAGVYAYGSTARFPSSTYAASDYGVSPVFVAGLGPATTPTTTPPAPTTPTPTEPTGGEATTPPAPPTQDPSGQLMGWQLNATNVGLAPHGLSCDSLPAYNGPLRPAAGARISGVRITGVLDLSNGDIQITRSCIRPTRGDNRNLVFNDNWATGGGEVTSAKSVLITDSEFDGSLAPASEIARSCAFRGVGVLQRNYMHGMGSGICFFGTGNVHDALAENNYVTGLRAHSDSHNEAATIRDFVRNTTDTRSARFVNNRLDCRTGNDTGGLFIQPTWENIRNVWIEGNYLEGAGYNLYIEDRGGVYSNVHATNNRFRPTSWGPSAVASGVGYATWRDNYLYDATKADGRGGVVGR